MPPMGKMRIRYDVRENHKGNCEIVVDDKVVCELPVSKATWELVAGDGMGYVTVQLIAERANVDGLEV